MKVIYYLFTLLLFINLNVKAALDRVSDSIFQQCLSAHQPRDYNAITLSDFKTNGAIITWAQGKITSPNEAVRSEAFIKCIKDASGPEIETLMESDPI